MTRLLAALVASALTANCATGAYHVKSSFSTGHLTDSLKGQDPPAVTAAYVKALPVGSRVKVTLIDGKAMKAILMGMQDEAVVIRPRTRVPEPAQVIPFHRIASIEMEHEAGVGRAIAIGAAVGAGAAIGVFLAILAAFAD